MDLRTNCDLFPTDSLPIDFMTGTKYVYCAVRTESLNIIQVIRSVFTFTRRTTQHCLVNFRAVNLTAPPPL